MIKKMDFKTLWAGIFGVVAIVATVFEFFVTELSWLSVISAIKDIAETSVVVLVFFAAIKHIIKVSDKKLDKLDHLDFWQENKNNICNCHDVSHFTKQILYGMQAAIHNGEVEELYDSVNNTLNNRNILLNKEVKSTLSCISAMLDVFIRTKRLMQPLSQKDFDDIHKKLEIAYEDNIKDADLAAWCRILRNDKQQLTFELYSDSLTGEDKRKYLELAVSKCYECIEMLDAQIRNNPIDTNYALLYRALTNRNLSQLYKKLYAVEEDAQYLERTKQFCLETLSDREELFNHYRFERNSNSVTMDYITQEYILALAEQYHFEEDADNKAKINSSVNALYKHWEDKNNIRNMIFNKIKAEIDTNFV